MRPARLYIVLVSGRISLLSRVPVELQASLILYIVTEPEQIDAGFWLTFSSFLLIGSLFAMFAFPAYCCKNFCLFLRKAVKFAGALQSF